MSVAASAYYGGRAEALGIDLPLCLNGDPVDLLKAGRLSIHQPNPETVAHIGLICGEVLGAAGAFVTAETRAKLKEAGTEIPLPRPHANFARDMVTRELRPSGMRTGHYTDITIEALSRDEVAASMFGALTPAARATAERMLADEEAEARQAYLLTTAVFKSSGRPAVRTGAFTMVTGEAGKIAPVYLTAALGRNAVLASSLLSDARLTSQLLEADKREHAYKIPTGGRVRTH